MAQPEPLPVEEQEINPLPKEEKAYFTLPDKQLVTIYRRFDALYLEPADPEAYNKYSACCSVLGVVPLVKEDYSRDNRPASPHISESGQELEPESHYKRRVAENSAEWIKKEKILTQKVARLGSRIESSILAEVEFWKPLEPFVEGTWFFLFSFPFGFLTTCPEILISRGQC